MERSPAEGAGAGAGEGELPPAPLLLGALESSGEGILVTDRDGSILYHNRRFAELFGLSDEALDGTSGRTLAERVKTRFLEPDRFVETIRESLDDPEAEPRDEFRMTDGAVIERTSRPLRIGGELVGRVSRVREVTELREEQHRLEAAQRLARIGSWEWNVEADDVRWSDELYGIFGVDPEDFEPGFEAFLDFVHPDDRERVRESLRRSVESGDDYVDRFRIVRPDDRIRHLRAFGESVTDVRGEVVLLRGVEQDITELEEARRERNRAERRYRTLFRMSPLALAVSRPAGEIVAVNESFEELLEYRQEEVVGENATELQIWTDLQDRADVLRRLDGAEQVRNYPTQFRSRSGTLLEVELSVDRVELDGDPFLAWAIRDVTERNEYRRELEQKALYDQLTGLPNRSLLFDRLEHAASAADRDNEPLSVLFVDLDDFKAINTRYGHTVGDRVLAEATTRLEAVLRESDTLGRLGGDEFLAVLRATDEAGARKAARRLLAAVTESPFAVPDGSLAVGASVGIAPRREDLREPEDLIRAADAAMRRAKEGESETLSRFRVFSSEDEAEITRLERKDRLRTALEEDELTLHYQPVMDLVEEEIVGAEALIRWRREPEGELVYPGEFIPFAEQTGLIAELDRWTLRTATRQATAWMDDVLVPDDAPDFHVATNVAAPFYQDPDFGDEVWAALADSGLPPSALQLEITERLSVSKIGGWSRLRGGGVRLAVDDFGTGYSSLRYLRQLDADALKVDRYFIQDLAEEDSTTSVIVRSVLSIGRQMGLDVIAEGVETAWQRDHLADLGYRYAQGYFFARPMPGEEFRELLEEEDGGSASVDDPTDGSDA